MDWEGGKGAPFSPSPSQPPFFRTLFFLFLSPSRGKELAGFSFVCSIVVDFGFITVDMVFFLELGGVSFGIERAWLVRNDGTWWMGVRALE